MIKFQKFDFVLILVMVLMAPVIIFDQIAAEGNMLQAIKNQTSYSLEEIQNTCQGRYLIDVPSLNCGAINQCLSVGLSIAVYI